MKRQKIADFWILRRVGQGVPEVRNESCKTPSWTSDERHATRYPSKWLAWCACKAARATSATPGAIKMVHVRRYKRGA